MKMRDWLVLLFTMMVIVVLGTQCDPRAEAVVDHCPTNQCRTDYDCFACGYVCREGYCGPAQTDS